MSFLQNIAKKYIEKYPNELSDFTFVFPNRRAGLFFRRYLAKEAGKPLFSPRIITIEQLFEQLSSFTLADRTELLFRIYDVYRKVYLLPNHQDESFDNFLFWGKMMLSDFNDVDMHLVDAEKLFSNLSDIKNIELRFSEDLSEEQLQSLRSFIEGFSREEKSDYRKRFMHIWQAMFPTYNALRENLRQDGIAYQGMLCRDVLTKNVAILAAEKSRKYIFVGFNALSAAEYKLMLHLKEANLAEFCWDYNHPFLRDPDNRASLFMRHDGLDDIATADDNLEQKISSDAFEYPNITLIEIPSETAQASVITTLLQQIASEGTDDWTKTGIVMPDERLLIPVKDAIPECVGDMNITMGLSLADTPIVSLLQHLSELQTPVKKQGQQISFYHLPVLALLSHPYITNRIPAETLAIRKDMQTGNMTYVPQSMFANNELLNLIFTHHESSADIILWLKQLLLMLVDTDSNYLQQRNEYIYQTLLQLNKLDTLLKTHSDISITGKTMFLVLIGLVSSVRIPFEGEPLAGMQIMGMLESRGMDFDNLIITDVNDDTLPGSSVQQTYIPYDLRRAYGLPTPERQDAVFAYNFYRLIAGAGNVWLLQNTTANDMRSGEVSRYVSQLEYQYHLKIKKLSLTASSALPSITGQQLVNKDKIVIQELTNALCTEPDCKTYKGLSASALNTYVQCPLKFYLTYIRHLRESDKITEDMEANKFGDIIHKIMQHLYQPYEGGKTITETHIKNMLQNSDATIKEVYCDTLWHNSRANLEGKDFLYLYVINQYVSNILKYDLTIVPFQYVASEIKCETLFHIENAGDVKINGTIDRIDIKDGVVRLVDYKTGSSKCSFSNIESIYTLGTYDSDHVRQILLYCLLLDEVIKTQSVNHASLSPLSCIPAGYPLVPHIYYVQNHKKTDTTILPNATPYYSDVAAEFSASLQNIIADIFNSDIPFASVYNQRHCNYCPFLDICK